MVLATGTSLAAFGLSLAPSAARAQQAAPVAPVAVVPSQSAAQSAGQPPAVDAAQGTTASPDAAAAPSAPVAGAPAAKSNLDADIVVTGTRVVRNGYQAPNPTSVLSAEEIAAKAPTNIADYVNELPALAGSVTPRNNTPAVSAGNSGISALNLRNLGVNRTLVLLDGQRVGPASISGLVDINEFPQSLIKRVDVVTGGASADWGSDAVAGVVNFVLDRDYTGLKGDAQGGVTTYGDDRNYRLSLTAGAKFAGGRGHVILSGEAVHNDGISGIGDRSWYTYAKIFVNLNYTATNGQPQLLSREGAGFATATPGGIITASLANAATGTAANALRGTYFGPNGTPLQFNYGSIIGGNVMQGGQYQYADWGKNGDLDPRLGRQNVFGRVSFDITDNLQIFAQLSWGRATSNVAFGTQANYGTITIKSDNAFIPASVAARVAAAGITSFSLGTLNADLGKITTNSERTSLRPVVGAKGDFNALGTAWSWDAYAQQTVTHSYVESNLSITANYQNAIDSVRNSSGAIVCRITLTNPNSGCVPYDIFGTGVNSQAALDYVRGTAFLRTKLTEDVVAANLRGDPFSTWAGSVSVALGIEHRVEKVTGSVDALDAASLATSIASGTARVPPYFAGNYLPSSGSYDVTEGYLQAVVPLAKDVAFAKSLDVNAGVRATGYSTSGYVTTWKVGATYKPIDDITFRVSRSRDIRAPNLAELFQSSQATTTIVTDPFRNLTTTTLFGVTSGNTGLQPEKADSFGGGVVLQPRFLPGLAFSADYWDISIKDAIATLTAQVIINQCNAGNAAFCAAITRGTTGTQINGLYPITSVAIQPINLSKQVVRGVDLEASYRREVFGGTVRLRALATRYIENTSNNGINQAFNIVGTNNGNGSAAGSLPKWSYNASIGWDRNPVSVLFTARGFSAGVYNTSYIECSTNCPASTTDRMTIDNNHLPGAVYFDANLTVNLTSHVTSFLSVDNIANKDPATVPWLSGGAPLSVNQSLYDTLGRTFRAGIRFRM